MADGTVTSADGTRIAYTAWGDGDPIIIIDGATAYRATTPENQATAELLAAEFRVINYDRRGRGESGDASPYAPEREFEDLAAIIEHAGGSRPATAVPGENHSTTPDVLAAALRDFIKEA